MLGAAVKFEVPVTLDDQGLTDHRCAQLVEFAAPYVHLGIKVAAGDMRAHINNITELRVLVADSHGALKISSRNYGEEATSAVKEIAKFIADGFPESAADLIYATFPESHFFNVHY